MTGILKIGRVRILQGNGFVTITWRCLDWWHLVGMFVLVISLIGVMAGKMGLKEVMGNPTILLTTYGYIVFAIIWTLLFYLVVFNRRSSLIANKDRIVLRNGLFPAFLYQVEMNKVIEVTIKEKKELKLGETDAGPDRGPFYRVLITSEGRNPIRTDLFTKEEAERICEEIKKHNR